MKKKLLGTLMSVGLVTGLLSSNTVLATPKTDIEHFMDLGFTQQEIKNFDDFEIKRYSEMNGKLVSVKERYYRVTEGKGMVEISKEQTLREVQESKAKKQQKTSGEIGTMGGGSGSSQNSWLSMTISVSDLGNKEFLFKNSFSWLTEPVWNLEDVVGLTHSTSTSDITGSEYLKYTYDRYTDAGTYIDTKDVYYWTAKQKNAYGYAFEYDLLQSDGGFQANNNRGYMVYRVKGTPDNFVGYSNAYAHYAHKQATATTSISLTTGSMSVSPGWAFDNAPDASAQFYIQ